MKKDFLWGVSTSAGQIEGSIQADGRGLSIWDAFSRIPGNIRNNDLPDVACDSYRKWNEDIKLLKELGVIYVMDGTAGGQVRGTRPYDSSLYKYAQGSYASSWAEYAIEGNTMKVTVKYFQDGQVKVCQEWGIKKSS